MSTTAMTGKDTIRVNGRNLNDFVDGDTAVLTFPDDLVQGKTGKNGNTIYALQNTGLRAEVVLRVLLGSPDDKFLNDLLALMKNDFPAFALLTGEFIKNVGDGKGNITQSIYTLSGGVFKKGVEVKENASGDTEQSVATYALMFSNAPRSLT